MSDLPDPLTPPDCDLRGYEFMPIFGHRLFGSRLYTKSIRNPRAGLAAIKLWWMAWQQCPAGSLPDDDDDLMMLADFGCDTKAWKAAREVALYGFVKCNDGRLYHPVLCREALKAFSHRINERDRQRAHRANKSSKSSAGSVDVPPSVTLTDPCPHDVTNGSSHEVVTRDDTETSSSRNVCVDGRGQDSKKEKKERKSTPAVWQRSAAEPAKIKNARETLWATGLPAVRALTGKPDRQARTLLGRLLRDAGDDCPQLSRVIAEALDLQPADPESWLAKAVRRQRRDQTDELMAAVGLLQ